MKAVEYANEHGRRVIGLLFPEAVERALQYRLRTIIAPKGQKQTSPGQRPGLIKGTNDKP